MTEKIKGQCLCGRVQFETGTPHSIDICHCKMCQRWSGSSFVGADFRGGITLTKQDTLTWYESSEWAKRGFCSTCGTSLFYCLQDDPDFWAVGAGTLDLPAGMKLGKEIFFDDKPDFYDFKGDQPRLSNKETMAMFQSQSDD